MRNSLEFILGLLDRDFPACVAAEDWAGRHGEAIGVWQQLGFVAPEPGVNPVPGCPHCGAGTLYLVRGRYRCGRCTSAVDPQHLRLWPLNLEAFLTWISRKLRLDGGLRRIDDYLWQLGALRHAGRLFECFFFRCGRLSAGGRTRLLAYRNAILLHAVPRGILIEGFQGPCLSLLELVHLKRRSLTIADPAQLLQNRGTVRFDGASGSVWSGDVWAGEVPVGSKEFHLLACLAQRPDEYVPYADIKRYVLEHSGSSDSTEEATFCQRLKNRIKKKFVPVINLLIVTTNKGDGYRLRNRFLHADLTAGKF